MYSQPELNTLFIQKYPVKQQQWHKEGGGGREREQEEGGEGREEGELAMDSEL